MDGASGPGKVMLRDSPGMAAQAHLSRIQSWAQQQIGMARVGSVAPKPLTEPEETHIFSRNFLGLLCFLWVRSGCLVGFTVLGTEPRADLVTDKWLLLSLTQSPGVFLVVPLLGRTRNQVERPCLSGHRHHFPVGPLGH